MIYVGTVYMASKLLMPHLSPGPGCEPMAGGERVLNQCMLNESMISSSRRCPCRAGVNIPGCQSYLRETSCPRAGNQNSEDPLETGKGRYAHPWALPTTLGEKEPRVCKGQPWAVWLEKAWASCGQPWRQKEGAPVGSTTPPCRSSCVHPLAPPQASTRPSSTRLFPASRAIFANSKLEHVTFLALEG